MEGLSYRRKGMALADANARFLEGASQELCLSHAIQINNSDAVSHTGTTNVKFRYHLKRIRQRRLLLGYHLLVKTVAASAGTLARMCLMNAGANVYPTTMLAGSDTQAKDITVAPASGGVYIATDTKFDAYLQFLLATPIVVEPGLYWDTLGIQGAVASHTYRGIATRGGPNGARELVLTPSVAIPNANLLSVTDSSIWPANLAYNTSGLALASEGTPSDIGCIAAALIFGTLPS